jgi:DNA-binding NarL/FixJ family response regulator
MSIRIAIVDDQIKNRLPLADRLMANTEIKVVFTATDGNDFLAQLKVNEIDVALMDIEMPDMNGIQAVQAASTLYPNIRFIMLTVFDDDDKIFEAIKAGASGYLLKDNSVSTILDGIKQVLDLGGAPMSPGIARKALSMLSKATLQTPSEVNDETGISEREMEILTWMINGLDYKAIAERLIISPNTVRKHIGNIYQKLHVNSKAQAIRLAMKKGWVKS